MTSIRTIITSIILLLLSITVSAEEYYVSPLGDDNNNGTSEALPFQTVQYAVDQMIAGDELILLDGIYTGTLKLKSGITLKAKNPRKVVFSGMEQLEVTFEQHVGNIYKAEYGGEVKQLFYNNEPMIWAQWPNITWTENWEHDKKWARASRGTGPGVLTSAGFNSIYNLNLTGAYCFIRYGKKNSCYSRLIESFDGTILHWNDDNFYSSKYTGQDGRKASPEVFPNMKESDENHPMYSKFFLAGALDLLDAPGEWFVKDNYLYLYPLDETDPNEADILTKKIDYCIYEEETISNVKIEGIDFIACSVSLTNSLNSNISFTDVHFKYPSADLLFIDRVQGNEIDKPISVRGTAVHFEKCLFAGAQNSALKLTGSDLHVNNCVFMENNRHANFEGRSLLVFPEGHYQFTHNTFFNNSSDALRIVPDLSKMQSLHPEFSYNHVLNQGLYHTDVSGIYFPSKSQRYAEVHHNWFHNVNGNAVRLDIAGKELNVHHNVFWLTYRAMSIEGYGNFNVYNNTAVYNETPADLIRNVLNHSGVTEASLDLSFPPIDDWNVLNNLIEYFQDRIAPREKTTHNDQKELGLLHPERDSSWLIPIVDRGSIQGNMTGERRELFTDADLSELNLIPIDSSVLGGVEPHDTLRAQEVCCLNAYRGAYDVNGEYWYPGSDWMPNGLNVVITMAEAESFAQEYSAVSLLPELDISQLAWGSMSKEEKSQEVIIRAGENMDYGMDSVAVMISETLSAPDGKATCQIACDVTPASGGSIMSADVYDKNYPWAWGLGFDGENTENRKREFNNHEWVSITNLRVVNYQDNESTFTMNDSSLAFQGFTVHKAGNKYGYDLVMFEAGETKHIANIASDDPTFINVADSAGIGLSAFGIGADQGEDINKWQVLNLVVKAVWQEKPTGLAERRLPQQLIILPNPVTDLFSVTVMPVSTEIYSLSGKKLKQFPEGVSSFDVSSLTKGVYIVKITTEMGNVLSQKLVKR